MGRITQFLLLITRKGGYYPSQNIETLLLGRSITKFALLVIELQASQLARSWRLIRLMNGAPAGRLISFPPVRLLFELMTAAPRLSTFCPCPYRPNYRRRLSNPIRAGVEFGRGVHMPRTWVRFAAERKRWLDVGF